MSGESPKATEIRIGCDKAQQGCRDQASSHGGGGTGSLYLQAPPSGSAGPSGVRSQRQPLHSHRSPRACFLSNDPASPQLPPCGNRNCSYLSRGRGPEPQLAVIKHPDRPGMVEILIARSQWPRRHSLPARGTVTSAGHGDEEDGSGGRPGNALASTQDSWGNQSPEKGRDLLGLTSKSLAEPVLEPKSQNQGALLRHMDRHK